MAALHLGALGIAVLAAARIPAEPPAPVISVSLIAEAAPLATAPPSPVPLQAPPPPETRMIAATRPTPSPMAAAPAEPLQPPQPTTVTAAPPSPAPAASTAAPVAAAPITPPNFTAAYLKNPGPVYPPAARRRREEGTVRLRVQVSPEGAPLQVVVERSSGSEDLDAAAAEVVKRRWTFAPARQGERAITAWVIVPMEFSLKR